MYGGHRPGDNLFSDVARVPRCRDRQARLALPDRAPRPLRLRQSGRADPRRHHRRRPAIKAVVQVTKQAFAFVLDRVTGKPVWPIEERPVPPSDVPGEKASPTQPFPTKPPAFDRQGITDRRPDRLHAGAARRGDGDLQAAIVTGPLFTPPSIDGPGPGRSEGHDPVPGSVGGADWTGAAFDPETGMLYVPSMTNPFVANLIPGDPKETESCAIAHRRASCCRDRTGCRSSSRRTAASPRST